MKSACSLTAGERLRGHGTGQVLHRRSSPSWTGPASTPTHCPKRIRFVHETSWLTWAQNERQSLAGEIPRTSMPMALRFVAAFVFGAAAVTIISAAFPFWSRHSTPPGKISGDGLHRTLDRLVAWPWRWFGWSLAHFRTDRNSCRLSVALAKSGQSWLGSLRRYTIIIARVQAFAWSCNNRSDYAEKLQPRHSKADCKSGRSL